MFKNYIKLTFKVLMRRKMFTFINLFGISFTLTILLAATTIYTLMIVANPIQPNLSKTLIINQVQFSDKERGSYSSGSAMPYFIEQTVRPLEKEVEIISFCSRGAVTVTIYLGDKRLDIDMKDTDENFWKMFSFKFLEGRPYDKQEIINTPQVVVICKSIKESIFGASPAVGKFLNINNKNYKVIGVVDDIPAIYLSAYSQVWMPYNYVSYTTQVKEKDYNSWSYQVLVQAKSRKDFEMLRNHFKREVAKVKPPDNMKEAEAKLESSFEFTFKSYSDRSKSQFMLVAFAILFSFIPLLNLTNLTVSRIYERASEIGVRKAFGATKPNMAVQFVYENIVVTVVGGILGFIGAWALLKGIDASGLMNLGDVDFSLRVYFYGFIVILIFGVISGLYPALKMSKLQIVTCLKGGVK
jgi:putative ABC transport system permease protein